MAFPQRRIGQSSLVTAVPAEVQAWYLLCREAESQPGKIVSREFLGRPIVLFRDSSGSVRRVRRALLLTVLPTDRGTEISLTCGVLRTRARVVDAVRVWLARWSFSRFFLRDVAVLDDIQFSVDASVNADACLQRYLNFLGGLPSTRKVSRQQPILLQESL